MRRRLGLFTLASTLAAAVVSIVRLRGRRAAPAGNHPDTTDDPVVDEWGKESFPASDPPQTW